ncbi:hypothetical protein VH1709_contig00153-0003 [Vibrio harveyi]|nr:hypothetical protein VH1709_contig00153-0003 [Vibrio harveyi]
MCRYLHQTIRLHLAGLERFLLATLARSGIRRTATHEMKSDRAVDLI